MSKYQFKIGDFTPMGLVDPKFQVEGGAPTPPTILLLRCTHLTDSFLVASPFSAETKLNKSTVISDYRNDWQK